MKRIFLIVLILAGVFSVRAQQNLGLYKAAEELVRTMRLQDNYQATLDAVIKAQAASIPDAQRTKYAAAMKEFFSKYATWDEMREGYIAIYASEFTESELKDLAQFYATATGAKYIRKMALLSGKSVQLGQKMALDHKQEMMEILQKHLN